eukprot:TRINITY_DN14026_c0_g1_i1.p1 TRINITY_DN14026_c0_g1~~TRINITY_DN14026_c0_g1_i1.p1  ORF type:complete len:210 (-),score=20.65 TRINITY_DN14026_c0_g1_i1:227-823(-)
MEDDLGRSQHVWFSGRDPIVQSQVVHSQTIIPSESARVNVTESDVLWVSETFRQDPSHTIPWPEASDCFRCPSCSAEVNKGFLAAFVLFKGQVNPAVSVRVVPRVYCFACYDHLAKEARSSRVVLPSQRTNAKSVRGLWDSELTTIANMFSKFQQSSNELFAQAIPDDNPLSNSWSSPVLSSLMIGVAVAVWYFFLQS